MTLHIKNMLCLRCIMVVEWQLNRLSIPFLHVSIGSVETCNLLSTADLAAFNTQLKSVGLELLNNRTAILIEKIKQTIKELIYFPENDCHVNISTHLSKNLNYDYTYLSNLFSQSMGISIEQYFITNRIDRAKELLKDNQLQLTQIAAMLQFSSVAHLSNQFKKTTGLSPSHFKMLNNFAASVTETSE